MRMNLRKYFKRKVLELYRRPFFTMVILGTAVAFIWFIISEICRFSTAGCVSCKASNYEGMADQYPGRGYCDETEDYILPKVHQDFITDEEREYILEKAQSDFEDSIILGGTDTNIRKSKTAWLSRNDPVVKPIIERVCKLSGVPHENAEKLQVVKYQPNGFYNEHHDAACDPGKTSYEFEQNGGQRKVTMLIYLSDEFEGGSTRFPKLDMELKPDKNSGILFYPLQKKGDKCHPKALHAGLPVISGEKYIANVWLRESAFNTD